MKKTITLFLAICLLNTVTIHAADIHKQATLSPKEKSTLQELNVNLDDIEVLDVNSVFSKEEIKKMEQFDNKKKENGAIKVSRIIYRNKNTTIGTKSIEPGPGDGAVAHDEVVTYTYDTEDKSDSSKGMKYIVDTAFSVYIGTKSAWIWIPATILGVAPSDLCPNYQTGDALRSTKQEVYHYTHYRQYSRVIDQSLNYVRTTKLYSKIYVDLYTTDINGKPVRRDDSEAMKTFYSKHYYDYDWIYEMCDAYASRGYVIEHHDELDL